MSRSLMKTPSARRAPLRRVRALVIGSPYDLFAAFADGPVALEGPRVHPGPHLHGVTSRVELESALASRRFDLAVVLGGSSVLPWEVVADLVQSAQPWARRLLLAGHPAEALEGSGGGRFDLALVGHGRARALTSLVRLAADRWWPDPTAPALLLVEDDPGWAALAVEVLQDQADRVAGATDWASVCVLWARTYEEAVEHLDGLGERLLAVVTDGEYPRLGLSERLVGLRFAAEARRSHPELPVILASADEAAGQAAAEHGLAYVGKTLDAPDDLLRAVLAGALSCLPGPGAGGGEWSSVRVTAGDPRLAPRVGARRPAGALPATDLAISGTGSVGGKGRGIVFLERFLGGRALPVEGIRVGVPPTLVLRTGVCEDFIDGNGLRGLIACASALSDGEIVQAFVRSRSGRSLQRRVRSWLTQHPGPVAVRSSASLEDCRRHPLAGAFATVVVGAGESESERLRRVLDAVAVVWASPFTAEARRLLLVAGVRHRPPMAVLLQPLVGQAHGRYFYPTFSGLASSYNYYPFRDMTPEDGVAVVAMGLGKAMADGREGLRFCPRHPHVVPQLGSVKDTLAAAQRRLWALDLEARPELSWPGDVSLMELETARELGKGIGGSIASTFLAANDMLVDGIREGGAPLVTFASLLRGRQLPLAPVLSWLLRELEGAVHGPVEIELAMDLEKGGEDPTLWLLQCRPLAGGGQLPEAVGDETGERQVIVRSCAALGHGRVTGIEDIVVVLRDLDRARTPEVAGLLERLDRALRQSGRPYLLIGPGRWGSRDPWLGVPVAWTQVSGARAIVETDFADLIGDPSQGSHFFHHLTAAGIPFLGVHHHDDGGHIDWEWLCAQPAEFSACEGKVRHLRLAAPLDVVVDGRRRSGVVCVRSAGE
jgi:CheY-like chemotaxis protein